MNVNYFEIPVTDIHRATGFYESVFNVKLVPLDLGPIKMALFGDAGSLMQVPEVYIPSHRGALVYFESDDIDSVLLRVEKYGGRIIRIKTEISETFRYMGCFEDSEGNRIALRSK
jgi:predicted enzyme related to lactoylglutathione lyase